MGKKRNEKQVKRRKDDASRMTLLALKICPISRAGLRESPQNTDLWPVPIQRGVHQFLEGSIVIWEIQDGGRSVPQDLKLSVDAERNQKPAHNRMR